MRLDRQSIFSIAAMLIFVLLAGADPANADRADQLRSDCMQYKVWSDTGSQTEINRGAMRCVDYFYPIRTIAFDVGKTGGLVKHPACVPQQTTVNQFIEVFLRYVNTRPEIWHLNDSDVVLSSITSSFPCSR